MQPLPPTGTRQGRSWVTLEDVPSTLPDGAPAPADGALPAAALAGAQERSFGVYLHVPFCAVRCGYCDFNTYTATELGGGGSQAAYAATAAAEVRLAARVLAAAPRPASTVFFGGGTPTLLPVADLAAMLAAVRAEIGLTPGAEVTTEANPDSVTPQGLQQLAEAGFTRVSFGMQSAVPHVLAVLERTHDPARVPHAVRWAREAGLDVSLDLIYGTPGESVDDLRRSLDAALACEPDHVSAYALIVEEGTRLAGQIRRGEVPAPLDDDEADKYEVVDDVLSAAGHSWYEVSNWARGPEHACRHNLAYWRGGDWWGIGPGAHSHVGGVRWWNVKHPSAYAGRIGAGASPAHAREVFGEDDRRLEDVLLRSRLAEGFDPAWWGVRPATAQLLLDGLLAPAPGGRVALTRRGRLLADAVVHRLLADA